MDVCVRTHIHTDRDDVPHDSLAECMGSARVEMHAEEAEAEAEAGVGGGGGPI